MKSTFFSLLLILPICLFAQDVETKIANMEQSLVDLENKRKGMLGQLEDLKLEFLRKNLKKNGLPKLESGEELIEHEAMSLVYSEEHEQAKWVSHIIMPDVTRGSASRSNDFREDPKVKTGTAIEIDYFLTTENPDGTKEYDGFGFDRGHLAPSADFRWSKKALSESYFYSNMAPQRPEFNRESWGELEAMMRGYMYHNKDAMLYVVTGPVLKEGLPVIERSVNKVSIPEHFFKVVVDLKNKRAIGFVMPNQLITYPIESFAKPINEIEELTGIDFFHALADGLEEELESMDDVKPWLSKASQDDVAPIHPPSLKPGQFNTVQAKRQVNKDKEVSVCGTVVYTKKSKKGNAMIYLDKNLVDPVFIIFVRKESLVNFSYDLLEDLKGQEICVSAKLGKIGETPTAFIEHEKQISLRNQPTK